MFLYMHIYIFIIIGYDSREKISLQTKYDLTILNALNFCKGLQLFFLRCRLVLSSIYLWIIFHHV